ncbi:MAG: WS/DGAT/MGAT family O-acyltransferase [Acidimicrobiales bacterium]
MDRLTGQDAQFLYNETPSQHMHTLKIAVADVTAAVGGYSFDTFRRVVAERLHVLPELRRRVAWAPLRLGHPWWVDDPDFDLDRHLHRATLAAPGDRSALDALTSRIAGTPLPADRPLWEIWVAEGLADGRVAFITKIHHAVADGARAAEMLAAITTTDPAEVTPPPAGGEWSPAPLPSFARRLRTGLAVVAGITAGVPALVARTARALKALVAHRRRGGPRPGVPFTGAWVSFNGALTPRRSFATATVELDRLRHAKRSLDVTLNDIVLAMVTGGVRRYLDEHGDLPDRGLVAGVPVSTRTGRGQGANRVSNLFVDLPVHLADPRERLQMIHDSAEGAKAQYQVLGAEMLADWSELTPAQPYRAFMRWYSGHNLADRGPSPLNLVVSNVPGPREPLFIAGARIVELYSVGPILEGIGLNVTVWSYIDRLYVGILGCPDQQDDLRRLAEVLPDALSELEAVGASPSA